jgi:hypothetical protein
MRLPSGRTPRLEDTERAMREIARLGDPIVAGLITGLVQMQGEILQRLDALERRMDAAPVAEPLGPDRGTRVAEAPGFEGREPCPGSPSAPDRTQTGAGAHVPAAARFGDARRDCVSGARPRGEAGRAGETGIDLATAEAASVDAGPRQSASAPGSAPPDDGGPAP